jgi:hypothetical protein
MISYSGLAVILAFFIVLAMRRLSQSTKPEDIQRISELVTEWTGWVILLLAFSFSESQSILHVSRHLYFPLAVVGLLLLGVSNFRRYKKGNDKSSLISVVVVIICLATECFRYFSGLERLTF